MARQTVPDQPKKGIWKPKKDDAHREGTYLRRDPPKEGKEKYGDTCILRVADGSELKLPNHEILTGKMAVIPFGAMVWIDYIGKGDDGKTYLYKVEFDTEVQKTISDVPKDNNAQIEKMKKLKEELIRTSKLWPDGVIPEAGVKAEIQRLYNPGEQTEEMFRLLKFEGWLVYSGNGLKVVI